MPNKLNKSRFVGALVIAMSLMAPSANAANVQVLRPGSGIPTQLLPLIAGADVVQVDHRHRDRWTRDRNGHRFDRRGDRRVDRRGDRRFDRRNDDRRYRHGHRGYRDYRPGYRRDNDGWWYPLAAFALGAIIADQNRSPSYSQSYNSPSYGGWNHIPAGNMNAHDNWCDRQYRSYSRSSKTFQPYNGPRRYCNSPYDLL